MADTRSKLSATSTDEFDLGVTLGTGSFGRVRFVTHKASGSHWAIKILKKSEVIRLQQVEHMIWEKTILEASDHPFIVYLTCTFQDPRHLYMVLEYVVGGEFFTHLRNAGRLDANSAKFYSAQVAVIFQYLHESDFIYRDLKPENCASLILPRARRARISAPAGRVALLSESHTPSRLPCPRFLSPPAPPPPFAPQCFSISSATSRSRTLASRSGSCSRRTRSAARPSTSRPRSC